MLAVVHIFLEIAKYASLFAIGLLMVMYWFYRSLAKSFLRQQVQGNVGIISSEARLAHIMTSGDEADLAIGAHSWHYAAYQWWLEHRVFRAHDPPARPNLCHFFWAIARTPVIWFMTVPVLWGVSMVVCCMLAVIVGLIIWLTIHFPAEMKLLATALGVGSGIAAIGILAIWGFITVMRKLFGDRINGHHLRWASLLLLSPIWGIPIGTIWLYEHYAQPYGYTPRWFFRWFFTSRKFYVVTPWSVLLVLGLGALRHKLGSHGSIIFLQVLGFMAAIILLSIVAVAIIVSTGAGILWLYQHVLRAPIKEWRVGREARRAERGMSTFQLVKQFILAKKRKICPYLVMPEQVEIL